MTARVAGPTRTAPGRAADCSAAATLTTSPSAPYSTLAPPPMGPTTAGPVSTPIRSAVPPSVAAAAVAVADRARNAARTARSGSSSCASGAPNIACRPRPDTEVTVPPNPSTSAITAAREPPTSSRSVSRPTALASPAGAATSANSTVTGRRSSRGSGGWAGAGGADPDVASRDVAGRAEAGRGDSRKGHSRKSWRADQPGIAGGRVEPLKRGRNPQPERDKRLTAALENAGRQLRAALGEVGADERAGGLLAGGVVVQAGFPGRQHVVAAGPARAAARSLARQRRASWRSVASRSRTRPAQSA